MVKTRSSSKTNQAESWELSELDVGFVQAATTLVPTRKYKYSQGRMRKYCTRLRVVTVRKAFFVLVSDVATVPMSSIRFSIT